MPDAAGASVSGSSSQRRNLWRIAAVFARPIFGGALYDDNGYLPFKPPIGPSYWRWDVNVTAFTILSAIALTGVLATLAS